MALTALNHPDQQDIHFNPALLHKETLMSLLGDTPDETPTPDPEFPRELADLIDNGGTPEQAMDAIKSAVFSGVFLDDTDPENALTVTDREALWKEIETDIAKAPTLTKVNPAIVAENLNTFQVFRLHEYGERLELYIHDEIAVDMPLGAINQNDFKKIIIFIQGILDTISLAFALLTVGVKKGKTWAKDLADKLSRPKNWLDRAKSAFGKFKKAYNAYERYLGNSPEETKKARKTDAAIKAMSLFASAFLGFVGVVLKTAWRILRMLMILIFGNAREVLRLMCMLTKAAIEWIKGPQKVAQAILDAVLAAIAVWDDVVQWNALRH